MDDLTTSEELNPPKNKNVEPEVTAEDSRSLDSLDKFIEATQPLNSIERAIGNTLFGINHRKIKNVLPQNKDDQGYTFFTRPQLNLTEKNLLNFRKFYPLLTTESRSIHRYVRTMLDPRLAIDTEHELKSPLLNPQMAFIPILTNTLKSISGWPDVTNSSFTSKAGIRKEQFNMVDGTVDLYESYDLDVTFNNLKEEPISLIFDTWLNYMSLAFEGVVSPYMDFIRENEIDYNTRIYRIVLTENKKYVKKIAATGASYPINVPTGKFFDATDERPFSDQTKDMTIRFKSVGAIYNDDILVRNFNSTVCIFNSAMKKVNEGDIAGSGLERIPSNLLELLNFRGYPRINEDTMEFEWWADADDIAFAKEAMNIEILSSTVTDILKEKEED